MREVVFLKTNADKWKRIELLLQKKRNLNPDTLAELFIQLTDDLAYSRTYYPDSKTTIYLNSLASKVHQKIYKTKKEKKQRIIAFWKYEFPILLFKKRKELVISFAIFTAAIIIGILSSAGDSGFVKLILGDSYVNMTLENIEKGDPMAVYKKMNGIDMFMGITFNNIRVSFFAFVSGLFVSIGTGLLLFYNGIMLGSFQYFFYEKGLLMESSLAIWIHGTIEISSIVVAGAAGLVLGNSFLFPGTYSRRESFSRGAGEGVKMVLGLIPLFIAAGFLESFVTRYTQMPLILNVIIILLSINFIAWYFILYPNYLVKQNREDDD